MVHLAALSRSQDCSKPVGGLPTKVKLRYLGKVSGKRKTIRYYEQPKMSELVGTSQEKAQAQRG